MKDVKQNTLKVVCAETCENCGGTGLRVKNEYNSYSRELEVTVDVCPCVKVVIHRGQNQHTKKKAVSA